MNTTLHQLLDANLRFAPEYGNGFSNHLPMALHALAALGASDARLRAAFDRYATVRRLTPGAVGGRVLDDWPAALGDIDRHADLQATFDARITTGGVEATLHAVVPLLWPGALGAAFHGLIRTAHAVQAGHAGEIAAALAYWAARGQAAPPPSSDRDAIAAPTRPLPFAVWAQRLEAAALRTRLPGQMISGRAASALVTADYAELAAATTIDRWETLSDWATALYARSGNFTVLHIVTGTRAARVMAPWSGDVAAARAALVRAVTAATLASQLSLDPEPRTAPPGFDWPAARAAAVAADDEHLIKLVHALDEEDALRGTAGSAVRLAAAARACAVSG